MASLKRILSTGYWGISNHSPLHLPSHKNLFRARRFKIQYWPNDFLAFRSLQASSKISLDSFTGETLNPFNKSWAFKKENMCQEFIFVTLFTFAYRSISGLNIFQVSLYDLPALWGKKYSVQIRLLFFPFICYITPKKGKSISYNLFFGVFFIYLFLAFNPFCPKNRITLNTYIHLHLKLYCACHTSQNKPG